MAVPMIDSGRPERLQLFSCSTLRQESARRALANKVELCSDSPICAASSHSNRSVCNQNKGGNSYS